MSWPEAFSGAVFIFCFMSFMMDEWGWPKIIIHKKCNCKKQE